MVKKFLRISLIVVGVGYILSSYSYAADESPPPSPPTKAEEAKWKELTDKGGCTILGRPIIKTSRTDQDVEHE